MKMFTVTKTVAITFTVEHVSDDPKYEEHLKEVMNESLESVEPALQAALVNSIRDKELWYPIVAGGWGVRVEKVEETNRIAQVADHVHLLENNLAEKYRKCQRECDEGGTCEFTPDLEYDSTGKTINCSKCGEAP